MLIGRVLFSSWMCFSTTIAAAASIRLADAVGEAPFAITRSAAAELTFSIVLQMANSSDDLSVVIWQLELELRPEIAATGELQFMRVFTPPLSLFGESPGPGSTLTGSASHIIAFDGDFLGGGQLVPTDEARNIVGLELKASPGASGTFQLITPEFDPNMPTAGSSFLVHGQFEPSPFDNDSPSEVEGHILLGRITFAAVPEPTTVQLLLIGTVIVECLAGARNRRSSLTWGATLCQHSGCGEWRVAATGWFGATIAFCERY